VQHERATDAWLTFHPHHTTQQASDFAADREPETGASILPAGRSIGLLERLEDQLLLVFRNADARVRYGERHKLIPWQQLAAIQHNVPVGRRDLELHASLWCELEGVAKQVSDHLLKPLKVRLDRLLQLLVQLDVELEPLLRRNVSERSLHV